MIQRINKKGQKISSMILVEVSPKIGKYRYCKKIKDKYYIEMYVEYSTYKLKRRKANKLARKQRKINNKKR